MVNFNDLPCEIKKSIYKINKKKETIRCNDDDNIYYCWYSKKVNEGTGCSYIYESINNKKIMCTSLTHRHDSHLNNSNDRKFVGMTRKKYIRSVILKK